jgi:hypothetical protein
VAKDFPDYEQIEAALIEYLAKYGPCEPKTVYGPLANFFKLTEAQRNKQREDDVGNAWENRVQWTRQRLKNKGHLSPQLRVWKLSPAGMKAARA